MKKITLLFAALTYLSVASAQQNLLLEKYRLMALQYNHDLKAAEKNISASLELEKSARADLKPKVTAGANFQYTGNPAELTLHLPAAGSPLTFRGQNMQYGASASLLQPLYTGGRILESIRQAQLHQTIAEKQSEIIRAGVCFQTDMQYWNTVARQEIIGVTTDFHQSVSELTKTIRERVEAGLTDPQDLLMAEVKLNEAAYQLLQAKNDFETGRMALNSIIGVKLQEETEIESVVPSLSAGDTLRSLTGENRPEILVAEQQILLAETALRLKDAQYKPQLYVGIDGNYSSPGYNFNRDMAPNYAAYARLSIPLFEWGKRRSEKKVSSERIGIANDQLNRIKDEVTLEIQTAKLNLLQAQERVSLSKNSLGKALENEGKALERYQEGKTSILEVIDAQTYRQTSQLYYVQAKTAAQGYYSALLRALNAY